MTEKCNRKNVSEKERLRFYEFLKRHISRTCHSQSEYERRIQRVIDALGV